MLQQKSAAGLPFMSIEILTVQDRMEVWNIDYDIEYAVVPGGHSGPVISLYAVKGGTVGHVLADLTCRVGVLLGC